MELIGRSRQSPLIGRTHELETLRALLLETEQRAHAQLIRQEREFSLPLDTQRCSQCVVLFGEAGIGKTRLAEEVSREAQARGWTAIWSRMYVQERGIPYRLWIETLRKVLNISGELVSALLFSAQDTLSIQPLTALLPELGEMFTPSVDTSMAARFVPGQEQLRLWEAARDLLIAVSGSAPLLIVLDDLQWIDASSCELLGYLARNLYGYPIVLIGTCRESELPVRPPHPLRPLIGHMQREHAVITLNVEPLTAEQISQLISSIANISESVVPHIQARAAGNPFFAEELARSGSPTLPKTVEAALDHRIGRLSASCQQLLSHAAVLGGPFEFSLIYAMEASSTSTDEETVLALLEEALQSGVLTEEGTGARITYHFWHPLLISHLYEKLSAIRRARLHQRVAETLLRLHREREEEVAAIITHHLVLGGADSRQIARYAELAGNHAYAFASYPDAEKFYRITLEHLEVGEKVSANSAQQLHYAYILECLGECMRIQGKYEEARIFYDRALGLYKQRTLLKSSEEHQQEAQIQALLWCEIGLTWYSAGKNVEARQCYQRSEHILQEASIVAGPAWAYLRFQQSYVSWREGMYEEAREQALAALKLFEEGLEHRHAENVSSGLTHSARILRGDPVNLGRVQVLLGLIATGAGQCQEALKRLNMGLTLYERYASQRETAIVCCNLGDVHLRMAEYDQAQVFFQRSLSLAERIGEIPLVSIVFGNLGVLDTRCGNLSKAEDEFRKSVALAEHADDSICLSIGYTYLATVLQKQGRLIDAGVALRRSLAISRVMRIAPHTALALMTLGSIRIAQAMALSVEEGSDACKSEEIKRNLKRAKKTLQHTLSLEGIEAETRTEARLMLAQAILLLGDVETALSLATQTLEETDQFELTWLTACTQRLLGDIFAAQGKYEQAEQDFGRAMQTFRASGMRLDYAHTLYQYSEMLMGRKIVGEEEQQRAFGYLQEAHQIFIECKAMLDIRLAERALAQCR